MRCFAVRLPRLPASSVSPAERARAKARGRRDAPPDVGRGAVSDGYESRLREIAHRKRREALVDLERKREYAVAAVRAQERALQDLRSATILDDQRRAAAQDRDRRQQPRASRTPRRRRSARRSSARRPWP